MIQTDSFRQVQVTSAQELRNWLENHHSQKEGVWLVTFKKSVPHKYLSTSEVLDELLCFGWIDGIRRKLDEQRTMQLISPRKVDHWSKTYKERAAKLIEGGKMQEAGFRSIALSKEAGLWDYMDDVDKLIVPEDLSEALKRLEGAEAFFDAINDSSKRFVLRWIKLAKSEKTRISRIERIAQLSARGEKLKGS
ncbi:YdeI/OmpD-associated family protein [Lunatimonas salinarum]|uniref:YdeI/OmpD-associated family protein n=1 Tax=Lunatimonas salinarum TaxID=1774590 RepID=UPI001ADFFBF9|nr:YdeI/OmpD-associated family protein [Lunatimonas salinarum]